MVKNLAAALAAASSLLLSPAAAQKTEPLRVGFVYVAPVTGAGWVRQHELGRQAVQAAFGDRVRTTFVENVPEGPDAERVIRDLARQGHRLIFTPSFGYEGRTVVAPGQAMTDPQILAMAFLVSGAQGKVAK